MARRGVVDRNPTRRLKSGQKHRLVLGDQRLQTLAQQPNHLAFGDHEPHAVQQGRQPLSCHLALEMAGGDEPSQLRAEAAPIRLPSGASQRSRR